MSFLNPRLNGKPRVVHLNCALMACGDGSIAFTGLRKSGSKRLEIKGFRHFGVKV